MIINTINSQSETGQPTCQLTYCRGSVLDASESWAISEFRTTSQRKNFYDGFPEIIFQVFESNSSHTSSDGGYFVQSRLTSENIQHTRIRISESS